MSNEKKYLIVVVGPTASGKTALAIELANFYNTIILSSDSRQFFKEMAIGTAKPSAEELAAAPHHFINSCSVRDAYSVGDFERDAIALLEQHFEQNNIAIMAGGSGLYVKAVCEGMDNYPEVDPAIRAELNTLCEKEGIEVLQAMLKELDPVYYETVDLFNRQRIIRALEICKGSGKPFSFFRQGNKAKRNFEVLKVGINWDRPVLYDRINRRVDLMLEEGLLDEVKYLLGYKTLNALQTVGYKELFDYLDGLHSFDEAVELIKRNTRRYAKRQMTWFRKESGLHWVSPGNAFQESLNYLEARLNAK